MVTVKVIYRNNGQSAKDEKVSLGFDSWARGVTENVWTDEAGESHFDADPGEGDIFVNGSTVYKRHLPKRNS